MGHHKIPGGGGGTFRIPDKVLGVLQGCLFDFIEQKFEKKIRFLIDLFKLSFGFKLSLEIQGYPKRMRLIKGTVKEN